MDYIDRKELRDALYDADAITMNGVKIFNQFPSADVSPVRHGRWLSWDELHDGNTPAKNVFGVFCSECIRQSDSKTHFCPNCGAIMEDAE